MGEARASDTRVKLRAAARPPGGRTGAATASLPVSANTELVPVDEELQSMNEELVSVDEELTTVRDELDGRIEELQLLDADLGDLLEAVEIPIVMLDANRCIRRFTPKAGAFLNLTPAAVGKPIGGVALGLRAPDLELWVAQTMQTGAMVESEVQDRADRWHRMQIRPHRALDGRADGTTLSLVPGTIPDRRLGVPGGEHRLTVLDGDAASDRCRRGPKRPYG